VEPSAASSSLPSRTTTSRQWEHVARPWAPSCSDLCFRCGSMLPR
jgi:hypothetical protein